MNMNMFCNKCNVLRSSCSGIYSTYVSKRFIYNNNAKDKFTKDMKDIPSPKGLPYIGTTLSLIMAGSTPKLHRYIDNRHKQLGSIFKENIGPVPCVFISDPEAMRSIFAHEGKYPIHLLPEAWTTYNTLHNVSRGIFFMNGEEWHHFRRMLNPLLLKGDQLWIEDSCTPAIDSLLKEFIEIARRKDGYPNMEQLLYQWSLEVIVSVLIGPFNYLQVKHELKERLKYLSNTVHLVFETSAKLALIPSGLASKFRIPRWRKFESTVTSTLKAAADLVDVLLNKYVIEGEGLLGKLEGQMTANELARIVTDLILAAGDTTAYSMQWLLYLVGKNPDMQTRLRQELIICKQEDQKVTSNILLKNLVKESLRLYPVAPFLTRILPESVSIRGYNIPAGTIFILSIFTTGRDKVNFQNPLKFDPDRWVRNEIRSGIAQSAALPFAIGSRSCIGRKLAETQLQQTLAEIVSNLDIQIDNAKDVDVILKMVAVPEKKIKFKIRFLLL